MREPSYAYIRNKNQSQVFKVQQGHLECPIGPTPLTFRDTTKQASKSSAHLLA